MSNDGSTFQQTIRRDRDLAEVAKAKSDHETKIIASRLVAHLKAQLRQLDAIEVELGEYGEPVLTLTDLPAFGNLNVNQLLSWNERVKRLVAKRGEILQGYRDEIAAEQERAAAAAQARADRRGTWREPVRPAGAVFVGRRRDEEEHAAAPLSNAAVSTAIGSTVDTLTDFAAAQCAALGRTPGGGHVAICVRKSDGAQGRPTSPLTNAVPATLPGNLDRI